MAFEVLNCSGVRSARRSHFRVQCPTSTVTQPDTTATQDVNSSEPPYQSQAQYMLDAHGFLAPNLGTVNGAMKCPQIMGSDGHAITVDDRQEFTSSLGPLSGLADIAAGLPGTQFSRVSNTVYPGLRKPGDPATANEASDTSTVYNGGSLGSFTWSSAFGPAPYLDCIGGSIAAGAGSSLPCPNLSSSSLAGNVDPRQISEYQTPASLGIKMHVVGFMAELLRDEARNHTEYLTGSITLSHGGSLDVVLDASDTGCESPGCVRLRIRRAASSIFYTTNLDPMSNDVENFGGFLTEVHICAAVTGGSTYRNTCN
jgi:hypothetical protein